MTCGPGLLLRAGLFAGILAATVVASDQDGRDAPDPEPNAQETLVLEYLNRFRADPAAAAERIARAEPPRPPHPELDWARFKEEVQALTPMPPLVFNPRLILAARNHSRYVVKHREFGHLETPGREGFSGVDSSARTAFVGFEGSAVENTVANTTTPWADYWGNIVDDGPGGTGGMQAGRGHRQAAIGAAREVGIGMVDNGMDGKRGERHGSTWLIGTRNDARRAGGVVFLDLDGDGFYSVGEGVGGVDVQASKTRTTRSWSSGAFALELEGARAVTLRAGFRGIEVDGRFPAGPDNVAWRIDLLPRVTERLEDQLTKAERVRADTVVGRKIRCDLFVLAEGLPLPEALRARVDAAATEAGAALSAARSRVLDGLEGEEARALATILRTAKTPYGGTLAQAWFREAERLAAVRQAVMALEHAASQTIVPKKGLDKARALVRETAPRIAEPALRALLAEYSARLRELAIGSGQDDR